MSRINKSLYFYILFCVLGGLVFPCTLLWRGIQCVGYDVGVGPFLEMVRSRVHGIKHLEVLCKSRERGSPFRFWRRNNICKYRYKVYTYSIYCTICCLNNTEEETTRMGALHI